MDSRRVSVGLVATNVVLSGSKELNPIILGLQVVTLKFAKKCYYGRPLHFTAVIYFYFVSIDERPAMGSQPNLASRSELVSIYVSKTFWGHPPNSGRKILDHLFSDFRTRQCISPE